MSAEAGIRALADMAGAIRGLAGVPSQAAALAAPRLQSLLDAEFVTMRSPYGTPWAPLKPSTVARKRANKTKILQRTRDMRRGLEVRPMPGAGLSMTSSKGYLAFHQIGTRYMAQRMVLPTGVLPREWQAAIGKSVDQAARKILRAS
jgi:hypothetical protein